MTPAEIRQTGRRAWGLSLYRSLIGFAFLLCAFAAFPEHKAFLALAVIVFGSGINAVLLAIVGGTQTIMFRDERSDRKTRWTILLCHQWTLTGVDVDEAVFSAADRHIKDEDALLEPDLKWWVGALLILWNMFTRMLGDLISIAIALVLTSG